MLEMATLTEQAYSSMRTKIGEINEYKPKVKEYKTYLESLNTLNTSVSTISSNISTGNDSFKKGGYPDGFNVEGGNIGTVVDDLADVLTNLETIISGTQTKLEDLETGSDIIEIMQLSISM
jgi:hypothetical protein